LKKVGDGRVRKRPTKSGMTKVGSSDPGTVAGMTVGRAGMAKERCGESADKKARSK